MSIILTGAPYYSSLVFSDKLDEEEALIAETAGLKVDQQNNDEDKDKVTLLLICTLLSW